jgi:hypothetical protein
MVSHREAKDLDTVGITGSNPVSRTIFSSTRAIIYGSRHIKPNLGCNTFSRMLVAKIRSCRRDNERTA